MLFRSPDTSLMLEDFWASLCADVDDASRVNAIISNGAFCLINALTTAPPCLPVAPVMKIAFDAIFVECVNVVEFEEILLFILRML